MSFSAPDALSLAGLTSGLPAINQADIPANIRNGNAKAKEAYTEGLEFEQVLVQQLAQQLASTAGMDSSSATDSDGSDGSGGDDSSSGLLGGDSSASEYSSLIPQALTNSIMAGGGLGVASEIAQAIDPSINDTRSTNS